MPSPTIPSHSSSITASSSGQQTVTAAAWKANAGPKPSVIANGINSALGLIEKSRELLPMALQQPEEQTDNWDDDFLEGISLTKLHGSDRTAMEDDRPEIDDNAQTIRPNRSPSVTQGKVALAAAPSSDMIPIVEDYSDLAVEEEEDFQDKIAGFKLRNSSRRGLFHPNDIKTLGLALAPPGPKSAPLIDVTPNSSRQTISPIAQKPPASAGVVHSRTASFAGSLGRAEAVRVMQSQEFDKYAEEPDEDYEDVFGKPNSSSNIPSFMHVVNCLISVM